MNFVVEEGRGLGKELPLMGRVGRREEGEGGLARCCQTRGGRPGVN